MKSMTGFGHASYAQKSFALDVQVRAVNGRYFELRLHAPREYQSLEAEIKKTVSRAIQRGTVDIYLNRSQAGGREVDVEINLTLAKKYQKALSKVKKDLKISGPVTLNMLAAVPDIITVKPTTDSREEEFVLVLQTLEQALNKCNQERDREGLALKADLEKCLDRLTVLRTEFSTLRDQVNKDMGQRFKERLEKLALAVPVDENRLAQEVAIQIDRSDINEELQRLGEHIRAYQELLNAKGNFGKKMDFYAQELLREVNTIGSKSQVARMTALVVEAKTIVERVREQVQNVE